jgi:hypothetical protein
MTAESMATSSAGRRRRLLGVDAVAVAAQFLGLPEVHLQPAVRRAAVAVVAASGDVCPCGVERVRHAVLPNIRY